MRIFRPMTAIEALDRELKRIQVTIACIALDGTEPSDSPIISIFNNLLRQKSEIQALIVKLALENKDV